MAQVSMTVRMDSQLKQNFDALCSRMGMSVNAAINIFANAVVRTRSIPFKISANPMDVEDQALREFREFRNMVAASDRPELTLDEINEEIRLAREGRCLSGDRQHKAFPQEAHCCYASGDAGNTATRRSPVTKKEYLSP